MNDREYDRVLNRALKLLGRKARSVAELRKKLADKTAANSDTIERVIKRLQELGYLNDQDYAVNYAVNKLAVKPIGRARLRRTLVNKRVPSEITEQALEQVFTEQDEERFCDQAIEKHLRLHGHPADAKAGQKLFAYLMRLGFPYDLVYKKIRAIGSQSVDDL